MTTQRSASFALGGGMDLVTPALAKPPGRVIAALNYEPVAAGYRRFRGFERFDGQSAPSEAVAHSATYNDSNGLYTVRQFLAGDPVWVKITGVWTVIGYALANAVLVSGAFGTTTCSATVKVRMLPAYVSAWTNGAINHDGNATIRGKVVGAPTALTAAADTALAVADARGRITAVPGSGPVRGVALIDDEVMAVRDDAGATAGVFHKSSTSGWDDLFVGAILRINSGGTTAPQVGGWIVGNAVALSRILSVTLISGTWAGGDAVADIGVSSTAFVVAEAVEFLDPFADIFLHPVNNDHGTVVSITAGTSFPAGGYYAFVSHNFYGTADLRRVYGVNGVGKAFEITSDAVAAITSTMDPDTPTDIGVYRNHLMLGFPGGRLIASSPGEPFIYDAISGAVDIGIGDDFAGIKATSGALVIFGENGIHALYGNDATDFVLEAITLEAGAVRGTVQAFGDLLYMDNRGIRKFSASRNFGNFQAGTVSRLIAPLLEDYRRDGVEPTASLVGRATDQYWVFFDNGTALVVYLGGKDPVILPLNLGVTVSCASSFESEVEERLLIGCTNGFVYELNKGTSFDGSVIEHYIRLPFYNFGQPQMEKVGKRVVIDVQVASAATIEVGFDFNQGADEGRLHTTTALTVGGAAIDDLGSNELYYASQIEAQAEAYFDGMFRNVSMKIGGSTSTEEPHTLTGVTYFILPREMKT